jgi:hypothetical protein
MKLVIDARDGRQLGATDLAGSRWEQTAEHFENTQDIVVELTAGGECGECYIQTGNERISGPVAGLVGRFFGIGTKVAFNAWQMRLSFHERHIADEVLSVPKVAAFADDVMTALRVRADCLRLALLNGCDIADAAALLLDAVDDLLALNRR